jgi:hypothetical protein
VRLERNGNRQWKVRPAGVRTATDLPASGSRNDPRGPCRPRDSHDPCVLKTDRSKVVEGDAQRTKQTQAQGALAKVRNELQAGTQIPRANERAEAFLIHTSAHTTQTKP